MLRMCYSHLGDAETEYILALIYLAKWSWGMNNSQFKGGKKKRGSTNTSMAGK